MPFDNPPSRQTPLLDSIIAFLERKSGSYDYRSYEYCAAGQFMHAADQFLQKFEAMKLTDHAALDVALDRETRVRNAYHRIFGGMAEDVTLREVIEGTWMSKSSLWTFEQAASRARKIKQEVVDAVMA